MLQMRTASWPVSAELQTVSSFHTPLCVLQTKNHRNNSGGWRFETIIKNCGPIQYIQPPSNRMVGGDGIEKTKHRKDINPCDAEISTVCIL